MAKKRPEPPKPTIQRPEVDTSAILKNLGLRLGLPLAAGWLVAAFVNRAWLYGVVGALTAAAMGLVVWAMTRLKKTQAVADILGSANVADKEGRKAALEKLDQSFKKGDVAATFARAQLLLQDDPDKALATLEEIDLAKVLPAEADQARFQRALIHLMRSEVDKARQLVDGIDLSRTEDPKARAMMAAVVAEAWGRTGQAKKAQETLDLYDAEDEKLAEVRPQLWRARAFVAASLNDRKMVRRALNKLASENPQFLGSFLQRRVHPLLEREAKQMLMQSGAVPRRVHYKLR